MSPLYLPHKLHNSEPLRSSLFHAIVLQFPYLSKFHMFYHNIVTNAPLPIWKKQESRYYGILEDSLVEPEDLDILNTSLTIIVNIFSKINFEWKSHSIWLFALSKKHFNAYFKCSANWPSGTLMFLAKFHDRFIIGTMDL